MSMDPGLLAQILAVQPDNQLQAQGQLAQQQQPSGAAADMTRKIMMMQALKNQLPAQPQGQMPNTIAPGQPGASMPPVNLQQLLQNQQKGMA